MESQQAIIFLFLISLTLVVMVTRLRGSFAPAAIAFKYGSYLKLITILCLCDWAHFDFLIVGQIKKIYFCLKPFTDTDIFQIINVKDLDVRIYFVKKAELNEIYFCIECICILIVTLTNIL